MAIQRPSNELKNKVNVIPVGVRTQEATAEDFKEISDILESLTDAVETVAGSGTPNINYGTYTSLALLQAAYPIGEENSYAIIDAGIGNTPQIALWDNTDTEWVLNSVAENVIFVANEAALPAPGVSNKQYITLDAFKVFIWHNSQYNLIYNIKDTASLINNGDGTSKFVTFLDLLSNGAKTIADAWNVGGMNVRAYATNYPILTAVYSALPKTIPIDELSASDITNEYSRRDAIVADATGDILVIKGTAATAALTPFVDTDLYYLIRDVLIIPGATEPVDSTTGLPTTTDLILFAEVGTEAGGESNFSSTSGTVTIATDSSISGSKCIRGLNAPRTGVNIKFSFTTLKDVANFTALNFDFQPGAVIRYMYFNVYFYKDTQYVGLKTFFSGSFGFNSSLNTIQNINIPKAEFGLTSDNYNRVEIVPRCYSATLPLINYKIDNVKLIDGFTTNPNNTTTNTTHPEYRLGTNVANKVPLLKDGVKVSELDLSPYVGESVVGIPAIGNIKLDNIASKIYGETTPLTGNITIDETGAIIGGCAIIYHNDSVEPNFLGNTSTLKHYGYYEVGQNNTIMIAKNGSATIGIVTLQDSAAIQYALKFLSGDSLIIPHHTSINFERTNAFSFSFDIKLTSITAIQKPIIDKVLGTPSFRGYQIKIIASSGIIQFGLISDNATANSIVVRSTDAILTNAWTSVYISYDGSSNASGIKIWLNKVLQTNNVITNALTATTVNTTPVLIGKDITNSNYFVNDYLDNLKFYNQALTQANVDNNDVTPIHSYSLDNLSIIDSISALNGSTVSMDNTNIIIRI